MKKIKLMPDYNCYPLWDIDKLKNIAPQELPLSKKLCVKLESWQKQYDKTLNSDYPPLSGFENEKMKKSFIKEAENLKKELQVELGNEYEIILSLPF